MTKLLILSLAAVLGTAELSLAAAAPPSGSNIILRKLASPRFFGAAANTTFLFNDANYTKVISTQVSHSVSYIATETEDISQFSIFTPENESECFIPSCQPIHESPSPVKWESIEPEPNVFNFGPADEIVRFAESIGAKVRGHNFEWYGYHMSSARSECVLTHTCRGSQLAPWVNSSLTATELDKALKNHITKILNHFNGKLYAVDVIVSYPTAIVSEERYSFDIATLERDDLG